MKLLLGLHSRAYHPRLQLQQAGQLKTQGHDNNPKKTRSQQQPKKFPPHICALVSYQCLVTEGGCCNLRKLQGQLSEKNHRGL